MEKAWRKGRFTTISRGYLVFEELFSGFSCFFGEKKTLSESEQRKTSHLSIEIGKKLFPKIIKIATKQDKNNNYRRAVVFISDQSRGRGGWMM